MYVFHSTVTVKEGNEPLFERGHRSSDDAIFQAPGFIKRMLLKDLEHRGVYFYISIWASFECLQRYRASAAVVQKVKEIAQADIFAAPIVRVECAIIEDRAASPSSDSDIT
jgi:heme-degrading monooxygenase HmoA